MLSTQRTKDILKEVYEKFHKIVDPYVVFLVIWSDDFEVNTTRKNKSSTWLKTVTFLHEKDHDSKKHQFTYALCLGNKKDTHFSVNKWYNKELIKLNDVKYKYSSIKSEHIPIVTRILVMSADRPERCALNDIASHSSSSTKRWMYSNGSNPHKMASCSQCMKRRYFIMYKKNNTIAEREGCNKCSDFDFSKKSKSNMFRAPNDYPKKFHQTNEFETENLKPPSGRDIGELDKMELCLYPMKLTYDTLSSGLMFSLYNFLHQCWSKKETITYLKLLGMKDSTILKMIDDSTTLFRRSNDVLLSLNNTVFPPMWDTVLSLDQFIETPMHHLFEGIVKAVIEILILYMKYHKKWAKYARLINVILNDVSCLNLEYCDVDSLSNEEDFKTGGWLAENYVGFSRIMIVIIGHFDNYIDSQELGFIELQAIFQTLFALLSRLMSNDWCDPVSVDDHVKMFLSVCHFYEKDIGFGKNRKGEYVNPFWYNKSNFVSLLNLREQIECYGQVRLHWEGLKEKFIQKVKPILKNKRTRVSYLVTKMERIQRKTNFDVIVQRYDNSATSTYYERCNNFQRFKSISQINSVIENYESFSGIVLKHSPKKIHIIHEQKDKISLLRLIFNDDTRFLKANLWYYNVTVRTKPNYIFEEYQDLMSEIEDCVMIIPYFPSEKISPNGYTILSKNWNVYSTEYGLHKYHPNQSFLLKTVSKHE